MTLKIIVEGIFVFGSFAIFAILGGFAGCLLAPDGEFWGYVGYLFGIIVGVCIWLGTIPYIIN